MQQANLQKHILNHNYSLYSITGINDHGEKCHGNTDLSNNAQLAYTRPFMSYLVN